MVFQVRWTHLQGAYGTNERLSGVLTDTYQDRATAEAAAADEAKRTDEEECRDYQKLGLDLTTREPWIRYDVIEVL